MREGRKQRVLVRQRSGPVAVEREQVAGTINRVDDEAGRDGRAHRMQLIFEAR